MATKRPPIYRGRPKLKARPFLAMPEPSPHGWPSAPYTVTPLAGNSGELPYRRPRRANGKRFAKKEARNTVTFYFNRGDRNAHVSAYAGKPKPLVIMDEASGIGSAIHAHMETARQDRP
jgi:hypothetical protein